MSAVSNVATNTDAAARARAVIPGGVNSPVRAFGSVGGTPLSIVSAQGATVTDVAGREYVDLVASWGPALLGHAHPGVVDAVRDAASRGLSFGASTPGETELAELVIDRLVAGGTPMIEKLRLVSTGTEATMTAIRLARGATGPRPHRQVRRALPRPLRWPARRVRLGHRDPRTAGLGRGARGDRRAHPGAAVQRP